MAYFADLTPYTYFPPSRFNEVHGAAVNVGWLTKGTPFPTGDLAADLIVRLAAAVTKNRCRGWHACELCGHATGNGEIHVPGDDVLYVAPVLIVHYLRAHAYLPPPAFVAAVRAWEPSRRVFQEPAHEVVRR